MNQRIGRLLEKYPMNKYYCLELKSNNNLQFYHLKVYFIRTEQTLAKKNILKILTTQEHFRNILVSKYNKAPTKNKKNELSWQEILRITNTQKIITTSGQNTFNELIVIRKCSYPNDNVKQIYTLLNYKNYPYIKRKFVVPKNELKKNETQQYCGSPPN